MAEHGLQDGKASDKEYPGGKLGEDVVRGVDGVAAFLRDFVDRLSFIAEGLGCNEPTIRGAELAVRDAEKTMWEMLDTVDDLPKKARELAGVAEGKGPLLPETFSEVALFKALAEARGMVHGLTARNFMCEAALKAFEAYKTRYAEPFPREEAVAAIVEATMGTTPNAEEVAHV